MDSLNEIVTRIDDFVWGPVMLILLVGTGIFLTVRTRFLTWRNLGYALKSTLSKEARTKSRGQGDVSPFSALTTALAATIGTGNIVGVATAVVAGGHSHGFRWSRSSGMDVDFRSLRSDLQIQ